MPLEIKITERANEILEKFKTGLGYDDPGIVIQEALYAVDESLEAYSNGNPKLVEGIISRFQRFK